MQVSALGKWTSRVSYAVFLLAIVIVSDVLLFNKLLGFGYPSHYDDEVHRYPAPYVAFTGRPFARDHNESGFRGPLLEQAAADDLKVAFFGGSTGYFGEPPITTVVEATLEKLLTTSVFVANYSVVSSNHRQHLHGLLENLNATQPDLVIFYGGFNEMLGSADYDPRPGYPYNHFYRAETGPLTKVLIENSAIAAEIDKKFGILSGIRSLRRKEQPLSGDWNSKVADKYFETLDLANRVTGTYTSSRFETTRFMAFYQPYIVKPEFRATHLSVKNRIKAIPYLFDVSSAYDAFGPDAYIDPVHVNQAAKNVMGEEIGAIVADELQKAVFSIEQ